jgi:hypothetical protein
VGSGDAKLYAFDATGTTNCSGDPKTCQPLWTATTGGPVDSSPAVSFNDGTLYVGSDDGKLYAFDRTGTTNCSGTPKICDPLWTATTGGPIDSSPSVASGKVYVGSDDGKLYAFDATGTTNCSGDPKTCEPLWTATTGGPVDSSPAIADPVPQTVPGGVVYVGSDDDKLHAFSAAGTFECPSGPPKTCHPLAILSAGGDVDSSPAVIGKDVIYAGSANGKLHAYNARGGSTCSSPPPLPLNCNPLWSATTGGAISSSPAVANGVVYVGSTDHKLYAFQQPPPLFAPPAYYGAKTGADNLELASQDLDGDTDPDIALTLSTTGTGYVAVFLNEGDGTFAANANYEVGGGSSRDLALGDFDGDTDPDIAVTNEESNDVSVLLNDGDGTFAAATNYGAGTAPVAIAVGDFDGDTDADLAVTNPSSDNLSVLANNGDGTFASPVSHSVSGGPEDIVVEDFDGDTDLDLALAKLNSHNVSLLLNNGDGTFADATDHAAGGSSARVAVADLDGDADPDLAVTTVNGVNVLLNEGNATFSTAATYGTGDAPVGIAVGDFDGDSDPDIASGSPFNPGSVVVIFNNGDGSFAGRTRDLVDASFGFAVDDFNDDAKLDAAVSSDGALIAVLLHL